MENEKNPVNETGEKVTSKKTKRGFIIGALIAVGAAVGALFCKKSKKNKVKTASEPITDENIFKDIIYDVNDK